MKKFLLILLTSTCYATGPKYGFDDPHLNDELTNIYHDISNPQTMKARNLYISTVSALGGNIVLVSSTGNPIITISTTNQVGLGYADFKTPAIFSNPGTIFQAGCNTSAINVGPCDLDVFNLGTEGARLQALSNILQADGTPGVATYVNAFGKADDQLSFAGINSALANVLQFQNGSSTIFDQFGVAARLNTEMYWWNENSSASWHWNYGASGTEVAKISSLGSSFKGTTTNDNASSGFYGEYLSSSTTVSVPVLATGSNQWSDVASVSATAGDWDITAQGCQTINGSTGTEFIIGIGFTAGNSGPSGSYGDDKLDGLPATAAADSCRTISNFRKSISATTTFYLKQLSVYSAGTPKIYGRLSARRIR